MGFVVVAGRFEPGTDVRLYRERDEGTLRVGAGDLVGRRLVDKDGKVGFTGVDAGGRYLARGFDVFGMPLELRLVGYADGQSPALGQPPILPTPQSMGTGERKPPAQPVGEPDAVLHTGVPAGVPLSAAA